jgi:hypothetical protein
MIGGAIDTSNQYGNPGCKVSLGERITYFVVVVLSLLCLLDIPSFVGS